MSWTIYCDGGASPNPGKGSYAAILIEDGKVVEARVRKEEQSTNQQMELKAVIESFRLVKEKGLEDKIVSIISDSAYCVNCLKDKWYKKWEYNGWRTAKKEPVANRELWEELLELHKSLPNTILCKVKGHSGDTFNEMVDYLVVNVRKS